MSLTNAETKMDFRGFPQTPDGHGKEKQAL